MKTRYKIIIIGIVLATTIFGTYQSLMYQCGTLPIYMETPKNPNLWHCLEIWEKQHYPPPCAGCQDNEKDATLHTEYKPHLGLGLLNQNERKTTVSDHTTVQLKAVLEYCIDSKDLVEMVGLSYYNETHFIDTITCEWQKHDGLQIDSEGLDSGWISDGVVKHYSIPSAQEFLQMDCEDLNHLYPEFPNENVADAWITRMHECLNEQENEKQKLEDFCAWSFPKIEHEMYYADCMKGHLVGVNQWVQNQEN
ncbi:MAG: hypothetical protein ACW9W4_07910 [Candidatus Nitrosopumilus sp. bin_7KS]